MNTPVQDHPTVKAHRRSPALQKMSEPLDASWLRQVCLDAGAEDVGFVEIDRPALAEERRHIRVLPQARSLISFCATDEPGQCTQSGALGREPGVSSYGR